MRDALRPWRRAATSRATRMGDSDAAEATDEVQILPPHRPATVALYAPPTHRGLPPSRNRAPQQHEKRRFSRRDSADVTRTYADSAEAEALVPPAEQHEPSVRGPAASGAVAQPAEGQQAFATCGAVFEACPTFLQGKITRPVNFCWQNNQVVGHRQCGVRAPCRRLREGSASASGRATGPARPAGRADRPPQGPTLPGPGGIGPRKAPQHTGRRQARAVVTLRVMFTHT
jgi:hypothetical protein